MAVFSWEWKKIDELLPKRVGTDLISPLNEIIRSLNRQLKKLENAYTQVTVRVSAAAAFANGATTPNVSQAKIWKTNNTSAPTSITQFIGASGGDSFDLIAGDANTTIVHDAAKIITKTGANRVLALNDVTRFITYDGVIFRECPRP